MPVAQMQTVIRLLGELVKESGAGPFAFEIANEVPGPGPAAVPGSQPAVSYAPHRAPW